MKTSIYQLDTFTKNQFSGNSAAVCPLSEWISDNEMQNIAMENNLAETAFFVPTEGKYEIRWFTPTTEVDLCGHATMAAAYVIYNHIENTKNDQILFNSRSGDISVMVENGKYTLDFPVDVYKMTNATSAIIESFNHSFHEVYKGKSDYMLVFNSQDEIESLKPDFKLLQTVDARGIIVTAPGKSVDFVCRFFAPQSGIDEDHVTGSAYTTLCPYWTKVLKKYMLHAQQLSSRGGVVSCKMYNDRVLISGEVVLYMKGEIYI